MRGISGVLTGSGLSDTVLSFPRETLLCHALQLRFQLFIDTIDVPQNTGEAAHRFVDGTLVSVRVGMARKL